MKNNWGVTMDKKPRLGSGEEINGIKSSYVIIFLTRIHICV